MATSKEEFPLTQKVVSLILAEMRNRADTVIEGRVITARNFVPQEAVEDWADRMEAAWKREKAVTDALLACKNKMIPHPDPDHAPPPYPGDASALREALEAMLDECCDLCDVQNQMTESGYTCSWRNRWSGCQSKAIDKASAALSAPPRNCDVGTAQEQHERWKEFCNRNWSSANAAAGLDPCDDCRFVDCDANGSSSGCQFAWAQMPYDEGGAEC